MPRQESKPDKDIEDINLEEEKGTETKPRGEVRKGEQPDTMTEEEELERAGTGVRGQRSER